MLLLDEPLSALDEFLRLRMRGELKSLQSKLGITFVHVTHTQPEAIALADMVVVMEPGRIEQAASPHDIFAKPTTALCRALHGRAERADRQGPRRRKATPLWSTGRAARASACRSAARRRRPAASVNLAVRRDLIDLRREQGGGRAEGELAPRRSSKPSSIRASTSR